MSSNEDVLIDLLRAARAKGASDLHVASGEVPSVRLYGVMETFGTEKVSMEQIRSFLKNTVDAKSLEKLNTPQLSGACDGAYDTDPMIGPVRIHAFRELRGIKLTLRLLSDTIHDFGELGLPSVIETFSELSGGLVLFVGPTGSGKTTALASLLQRINQTQKRHVITIEDPIEYRFKPKLSTFSQIEVGSNVPSYAEAMRGVLRSDPDVLLVGECRDPETMSACLEVAEQGRLCYSTVHARDASSVFDRIIGAFEASRQPQVRIQLASVIAAVVVLRLVPLASGKGRVAAAEVLVGTDQIRAIIQEAQPQKLRNAIGSGRKYGMQTLEQSLSELVGARDAARRITPETARAFAIRAEELRFDEPSPAAAGAAAPGVRSIFG